MSGIGYALCALNKVSNVDKVFFIICAVIIALIVAVYFLIPVFNKKLYQEQRDNLRKREAAFKSNLNGAQSEEAEKEAEKETDKEIEAEAQNPEVSEDK